MPPPPPNFASSIVFNLSRDNSNTKWKLDTRVKFSRGRGIVGDAKVAHGYLRLGWHFISLIKLFFNNLNPFFIQYFFILEKSVSLEVSFSREKTVKYNTQYIFQIFFSFILINIIASTIWPYKMNVSGLLVMMI